MHFIVCTTYVGKSNWVERICVYLPRLSINTSSFVPRSTQPASRTVLYCMRKKISSLAFFFFGFMSINQVHFTQHIAFASTRIVFYDLTTYLPMYHITLGGNRLIRPNCYITSVALLGAPLRGPSAASPRKVLAKRVGLGTSIHPFIHPSSLVPCLSLPAAIVYVARGWVLLVMLLLIQRRKRKKKKRAIPFGLDTARAPRPKAEEKISLVICHPSASRSTRRNVQRNIERGRCDHGNM